MVLTQRAAIFDISNVDASFEVIPSPMYTNVGMLSTTKQAIASKQLDMF
jgi:hypothetical protein